LLPWLPQRPSTPGLSRADAFAAEHGLADAARRQVYERVLAAQRPIGAYDLLAELEPQRGRVPPTTVYRALDFLVEHGFIHRIESKNAFFACCEIGVPHEGQFLICDSCGETVEIGSDLAKQLSASAGARFRSPSPGRRAGTACAGTARASPRHADLHRRRAAPPLPTRSSMFIARRRAAARPVACPSVGAAAAALSIATPALAQSATVNVVAAENFYGDVASQIGRHVAVTSILSNPDQDPHLFEASPKTARALQHAQIVIYNGANYDPWMAKLLGASTQARRATIVVADLVGKKAGDNPHLWYAPATMPAAARALAAEARTPIRRTRWTTTRTCRSSSRRCSRSTRRSLRCARSTTACR
jgi:Fe2+ or Zn2+ uptake regulation protein